MSAINPITGEELPLHDPHPEMKGAEEGGGFCAESEDEGVEVWGGREGEEGEGERGGRGNEEGSGEVKIEGGGRRDTRSGGFVVEDDIATDADLLEELENFPELSSSESLCSKCQGPRINSDWKESFGVSICNSCKYGNPRYDLVTKSKAKQHYLLTEGELSGLGTISKPNPHKSTWAPMKLYLKEQVVKISRRKYENEEALEAEKERRSLIQLEKSIRREKNGGRLPSVRIFFNGLVPTA
ncbi:hypothetical protein AAMO2058_000852800 [Amorphochlora amoebiformis]